MYATSWPMTLLALLALAVIVFGIAMLHNAIERRGYALLANSAPIWAAIGVIAWITAMSLLLPLSR